MVSFFAWPQNIVNYLCCLQNFIFCCTRRKKPSGFRVKKSRFHFLLDLRTLLIICAVCKTLFSWNQSSTSKVMAIYMYDAETVEFKFSRLRRHLNRAFLPFSVWWYSACLWFLYFFSLFKLVFSNWGKLNVSSTFHVNFCSFLFFLTYQPHRNFEQGAAMFTVSWV